MEIRKNMCPICVLVSGAWIVLLTLRFFGYDVSESFSALLMGGSVVGISYVLVKRIQSGRATLWKLLAIPIGFAAAWALLHFAWAPFTLASLAYVLLWTVMRKRNDPKETAKENPIDIKKELENCCDE